jgi:transposase
VGGKDFDPKPHHPVISTVRRVRENLRQTILKSVAKHFLLSFASCVAKLKNLVKDLHFKTCAYLTEHYDVILLPIFKTKGMVRRSNARTHGFNTSILSSNYFKFRQLLQVKCALKGKSLVVCSEMHTSRTCGRCYRLHVRLGSSDVFTCPFCASRSGRDENAALNILRYVCAGSLQVFE